MRLENLRDGDVSLAPDTVALLPLGATEAHGTHLPHGTDTFIAGEIAERVSGASGRRGAAGHAVRHEPALRGSRPHGDRLTRDAGDGGHRHPREPDPARRAAAVRRQRTRRQHRVDRAAARRIQARHDITVAALEAWWWAVPSLLPDDPILREPGGHASAAETAMALAAAEHLVDMDRHTRRARSPTPATWRRSQACACTRMSVIITRRASGSTRAPRASMRGSGTWMPWWPRSSRSWSSQPRANGVSG